MKELSAFAPARLRRALTIEMKLDGIRGVPWIVFDDTIAYTGPASQLDDTATFSIETTTDELTKARNTVAMNLM